MRKLIFISLLFMFVISIVVILHGNSNLRENSRNDKYSFGECEVILQVLKSQGDGGSDVVNLYARKPSDEYYPKWRWYYVDHESRSGNWKINNVGDGFIVIINRFNEVYRLSLNDFKYYKKGKLFSKGGSLVIDPYSQGYPVQKDDVFLR